MRKTTQKENAKELLRLIKKNPELPILPFVATECVYGPEYRYWGASWGRVAVDEYCSFDGKIYLKAEDYDEIIDNWIDENHEFYSGKTHEELKAIAPAYINEYEWTKAIVVFIERA